MLFNVVAPKKMKFTTPTSFLYHAENVSDHYSRASKCNNLSFFVARFTSQYSN